ncbi:hypothetical protein Syn6312_0393 [Synechococcus sp. PCC 6312]|nr:hypothetical protein Syn6312_0393 [Synechococcus sp. PCC 6312]
MTEVANLLGKERHEIRSLGREATAEFLNKCIEYADPALVLVSEPECEWLGLTDVCK